MVSLHGVCLASQLASVSGLIHFAHLDGPGFDGLHHRVQFHVDCMFDFYDRNFHQGVYWCRDLFGRDCWIVHHYRLLWERD